MSYKSKEIDSGEQEGELVCTDDVQSYIDQLPDTTLLSDSLSPSPSLQLYLKPSSMDNIVEGSVNNKDISRSFGSTPPSIVSSSCYSEEGL